MEPPTHPSYAGLVPMLPVTNVARAMEFYAQLGFQAGNTHIPDGQDTPVWAWLHSSHAHLMLNQADRPIEASHQWTSLWIYTRDVAGAHAMLGARGLDVGDIDYPFYNPGGEFHVHDPDGYAVLIAHMD